MKTKKPIEKYSVAELFCGCGGFAHGFWRTGRFETALGNDVKKFALQTFKVNHTHERHEPAIIERDIRTVSDAEIVRVLRSKGVEDLDCLLGGPPCQGFSQMRRTEGRRGSKVVRFGGYNKLDQDSRNDLVLRFLEIAHTFSILGERTHQLRSKAFMRSCPAWERSESRPTRAGPHGASNHWRISSRRYFCTLRTGRRHRSELPITWQKPTLSRKPRFGTDL